MGVYQRNGSVVILTKFSSLAASKFSFSHFTMPPVIKKIRIIDEISVSVTVNIWENCPYNCRFLCMFDFTMGKVWGNSRHLYGCMYFDMVKSYFVIANICQLFCFSYRIAFLYDMGIARITQNFTYDARCKCLFTRISVLGQERSNVTFYVENAFLYFIVWVSRLGWIAVRSWVL